MRSCVLMVSFSLLIALNAIVGVAQEPTPLPADLNSDGVVNYKDLFLFRQSWLVDKRPVIPITLPGGVTMEVVRVVAGSLQMGSTDSEDWSPCHPCEQPVHQVDISDDFYIGKYEVTQAQWEAVMGANPASDFGVGDNYPVYNVSWEDCQSFIEQLNQLPGQGTFRLPSEAEWEYACRAGTTTRFYFGDSDGCGTADEDCAAGVLPGNRSDYMWYLGDYQDPGSQEVGQLGPNAFGLYDMHGNVFEWCADDWHEDYSGAPADGSAWIETPRGDSRVIRGGHWNYEARYSRSACRVRLSPSAFSDLVGLRVVRVAQ